MPILYNLEKKRTCIYSNTSANLFELIVFFSNEEICICIE